MNFPFCSALKWYSVMPRASTRTVAPSFPFDAVFTSALDPLDWVAAGLLEVSALLLLLELLPQAASSTEAASVGTRRFMDLRTVSSSVGELARLDDRAANPKDDTRRHSFRRAVRPITRTGSGEIGGSPQKQRPERAPRPSAGCG